MEFEVNKLSKLGNNKIIIFIDNEFKIVLRTVIQKIIRTHSGLPLDWEDIYYEFLYKTPSIAKSYDVKSNLSFKTYLGIQCRYFTYNSCKKYLTPNHQVMNKRVRLETKQYENIGDNDFASSSINTSCLTAEEEIIYNDFFIDHKSCFKICKTRGISRYRIKNMIERIRDKLSVQIKN